MHDPDSQPIGTPYDPTAHPTTEKGETMLTDEQRDRINKALDAILCEIPEPARAEAMDWAASYMEAAQTSWNHEARRIALPWGETRIVG